MTDRQLLLEQGEKLLQRWCLQNNVEPPVIKAWYTAPLFDVCAFYRTNMITIWPHECARIGVSPRQWSYPGYIVDRTPYGVVQHELGHHVDGANEYRGGVFSHKWRLVTNEPRLTNYCPNDMEWFAELFRLFVTNPDLLRLLRPKTYALMESQWPTRVEMRSWTEVLGNAPERWKTATKNHLLKAIRPKQGSLLYG